MVTSTWILKEGASQGFGSTTPDCWNHLPVISSWKGYRQATPTLESCSRAVLSKATDAGMARGSEGFTFAQNLLLFFFYISPFRMEMPIQCLSRHCILEAHNMFDFYRFTAEEQVPRMNPSGPPMYDLDYVYILIGFY